MTTFDASGTPATDEPQLIPPSPSPFEGDDRPVIDPEPTTVDPEPEVIEPDTDVATQIVEAEKEIAAGTAIVKLERLDVSTIEEWKYDWLEFKGDKLGIRLPTRQALAAFSLASSKYVAISVKNDLTGLFIAQHLSPESYGRVFSRLMNPDENDYDVETVGELFNAIVTASIEADKAAEAKTSK